MQEADQVVIVNVSQSEDGQLPENFSSGLIKELLSFHEVREIFERPEAEGDCIGSCLDHTNASRESTAGTFRTQHCHVSKHERGWCLDIVIL